MAGLRARGWVVIHEDRCNGCGMCVAVCPMGCLEPAGHVNERGVRPARYVGRGCRADGLCFRACPETSAISVFRADPDARMAPS